MKNTEPDVTASAPSETATPEVPQPVAVLATVMEMFSAPWALCGGWAIDAWLGRETREHGDVDLCVFVQDQRALFEHLSGWQLLAHDATWTPKENDEWWDGRALLNQPSHIHGRPPDRSGPVPADGIATIEDGFWLDIQIADRSRNDWLISRDPLISMPLREAVATSPWGLPTVVPEVLLAFKARDLRRRDRLDFEALLPRLDQQQRDWLRDAISLMGHPW
ncbi:MAG: nucleotidyltransferase domain-containing protein, partial [Tepidiformaceae bacterium]